MATDQTDDLLGEGAAAREAARRLDHHERYLAHLRLAESHAAQAFPGEPSSLTDVLAAGYSRLDALNENLGARIRSRRRPQHPDRIGTDDECLIFVDECGAHRLTRSEKDFRAFALAAVLVRESEYDDFATTWESWKRATWGVEDKKVHEPDVRRGRGPFWFQGDYALRERAVNSLAATLRTLDFTVVVVVIRADAYLAEFKAEPMDTTLPEHPYHMALDFLAERLAMVLDGEFRGARGQLIVESRGPLEDAELQHEFARLQIDGTSYVSDAWFRTQFYPGISFGTKNDYLAGLEVADLVARPCAEKVLAPGTNPPRWAEVRGKLAMDRETAHSPLGIKIVPWSEEFDAVWES